MASITKGYKTGKAQPVSKCCREIRISQPDKLGQIYNGYNTLTNEFEYWMVIKLNKFPNDNIVQRIFP